MLLFVDLDRPGEPTETGCDETSERLAKLLEGLGPYTDMVQVVISSERARGRRLEDLLAELALPLPTQIVGNLWDDVPPVPLPPYEHIIYWLTRRHVWRLPSWFAVLPAGPEWPADQHGKLVSVVDPRDWTATSTVLRARLERYYWAELCSGGVTGHRPTLRPAGARTRSWWPGACPGAAGSASSDIRPRSSRRDLTCCLRSMPARSATCAPVPGIRTGCICRGQVLACTGRSN